VAVAVAVAAHKAVCVPGQFLYGVLRSLALPRSNTQGHLRMRSATSEVLSRLPHNTERSDATS
jgi:hypothetical protein